MRNTVLLSLILISNIWLTAQQQQIKVLPFTALKPLSSYEASFIEHYTIVQIERLGTFGVHSRTGAVPNKLSMDSSQFDSTGQWNDTLIHLFVTGTVAKDQDNYSIELTVGDDQTGDVFTDHFDLATSGDETQKTKYRQFLMDKSGLNDLIQPHDFIHTLTREMPFHRFGFGLAVSFASNPYYGSYVVNDMRPVSLMFNFNVSEHVFLILGGSYVFQDIRQNPNADQIPIGILTKLNSLIGKQDYYSTKIGIGARWWRLRLFTTYDREIAKDIDKSLANNDLIPDWNITCGLQFYIANRFYIGTELYFYKPVDYISTDGQSLIPVTYGTIFYPAICIGFN
jgi:hypothetical protein